jgi:hypothetical protein
MNEKHGGLLFANIIDKQQQQQQVFFPSSSFSRSTVHV